MVESSPNQFNVFCPCTALNHFLVIKMTGKQVEEVLLRERWERRPVKDILPDLPPPVQEIFISGVTPAECDMNVLGIGARSNEYYEKLGYGFNLTSSTQL